MNNTREHIDETIQMSQIKLTKANGRSNHLISIFLPFTGLPIALPFQRDEEFCGREQLPLVSELYNRGLCPP